MTDKEKTEFIDEMTEKIYCWLANEKPKIKQALKEGLEKGLAEGRGELEIKEGIIKYWKKLCKDKSNDVIKLQKENAELKAHCKAVDEVNEKMKCGENCKYSYSVNTGGCYDTKCEFTGCDCINCKDKWELAE